MKKAEIVNSITLNGMRDLDNDRCFQAMEEYANLHLSEQKKKHDKEMEEFAEWLDLNRWIFSTEILWYQNSDGNQSEGITTTDLLTKFKNR